MLGKRDIGSGNPVAVGVEGAPDSVRVGPSYAVAEWAPRVMRRLMRTACAVAVLSALIPIEVLAQGVNAGAGGDPCISVAQPEVSGKPSAIATTSIQSVLEAAGDPTGLRRSLSDHGIFYSFNAIADILGNTSGGTLRRRRRVATAGGSQPARSERRATMPRVEPRTTMVNSTTA